MDEQMISNMKYFVKRYNEFDWEDWTEQDLLLDNAYQIIKTILEKQGS